MRHIDWIIGKLRHLGFDCIESGIMRVSLLFGLPFLLFHLSQDLVSQKSCRVEGIATHVPHNVQGWHLVYLIKLYVLSLVQGR